MADNSNDILWREEFERLGEMQLYDNVKQGAIYNDEAKRQAAFRWLGEVAAARRARESRSYNCIRWTFYAAVGAVIVGVIGIIVTLLHQRARSFTEMTRPETTP